jgi:hypothetical protein
MFFVNNQIMSFILYFDEFFLFLSAYFFCIFCALVNVFLVKFQIFLIFSAIFFVFCVNTRFLADNRSRESIESDDSKLIRDSNS